MIARRYITPTGLAAIDLFGFNVNCVAESDGCPAGYMRSSVAGSPCVPSGNLWDVRKRYYCPPPAVTPPPAPPAPTTAQAQQPGTWTVEDLDAARRVQMATYDPYGQYSPEPPEGVGIDFTAAWLGIPAWVWIAAAGVSLLVLLRKR